MHAHAHRLCAVLAVLTAACGPAAAPLPTAVSVTDDAGHEVRLAAPARRVFSVIPSMTESVALIDAGVLVARTRFDRTAEVLHLPSMGGTLNPNVEAVAQLQPDLVISWLDAGQRSIADRMEALGIPVYRAEVQTVADIRSHLERLGVLLGQEKRARGLITALDRCLAEVEAAVAGRAPVDVYYSVWHDPPQTTGPGTFIDEVIRIAGGRNVFRDAPISWPQASLEEIVRRDPDAIIIARHEGGSVDAPWLRGPGWRELSAVRTGRYVVMDGDLVNRPGPRVVEAARRMARFLHGDDVLGPRATADESHACPVGAGDS